MKKKRVVIVGGGISGLTAAYFLGEWSRKENPIEITLLEARERFGGAIETQRRDGFLLEAGADSFLAEKPWARNLCKRLHIENEIIPTRDEFRRSFIYQDGKLIPVPSGFYLIAPAKLGALFSTPLLSRAGKWRMAWELFTPPKKDDSDESVAHFVRRRFGEEALSKIGQPMIGGIYMADPEELSLQATFPRFHEMERSFGSVTKALLFEKSKDAQQASGPRYSLFLSFRDGMEKLVSALVAQMSAVQMKRSTPVTRLEFGNPWKIHLEKGHPLEAEAVCLALSTYQAARLIQPFAGKLAEHLNRIPYESVATVNAAYWKEDLKKPLEGFGFVVPAAQKKTLAACTFSNVKYPGRAPDDSVLLRAFAGGALQRSAFDFSDKELEQKVISELQEILGIQNKPRFVWVRRFPHSMPQYHVGHLNLVRTIIEETRSYPGLYLAGNGLKGVGIPDCIFQAEGVAALLFTFLIGGESF